MGVLAPAASVCVNPDWTGGAGKGGGLFLKKKRAGGTTTVLGGWVEVELELFSQVRRSGAITDF